MNIQELFEVTQCEIKKEIKSGKVLAVATSNEWGQLKQQVCFQVEGEYWGQWVSDGALVKARPEIKPEEITVEAEGNQEIPETELKEEAKEEAKEAISV